LKKEHKVLEVGSGCGAVTGVLSRKAGSVTCVDLSKRRSLINAHRHSDADNIEIRVGNFSDVEPGLPCDYDYIFLIGVFEYGQCYIAGDRPFHTFLNIIKKHLKTGGRIVIAIENRLGLKYFAGCREDHLGTFFSGIENYPSESNVRTFSRPALEDIFRECGLNDFKFYYPYPDYKFPITMFSDERLPRTGELVNNDRNLDRDRFCFFDEKKAFDALIKDGLFPVFSNSYLVVLGGAPDTDYVRYSNDRQDKYAIKTVISGNDHPTVRKAPLEKEGYDHIRKLSESCRQLKEKYYGGKLCISDVSVSGEDIPVATIPFVQGRNLSEIFDELAEKGDREGFKELYREFEARIKGKEEYPFSDRDMVFSNILADGDTWTLIDYEWTVNEAIPAKRQAARALYCHALERGFSGFETMDFIVGLSGLSREEFDSIIADEALFQREVNGERLTMGQIKQKIGNATADFTKYEEEIARRSRSIRVQIYSDRGNGFSEADSFFVNNAVIRDNTIEFEAAFSGDVRNLRIDPMSVPCAVTIGSFTLNGSPVDNLKGRITANGRKLRSGGLGYVFATSDPGMTLSLSGMDLKDKNTLSVVLNYSILDQTMADAVSNSIKKIF
ncbi:MAG: class I SAM-dependent methyltransferase, partial [Lachnospiraceae bacterium]|nr:class I SAM-dependent methyltransferase [Lachnospiraceae bacterium]